jgi:LysM repeat protein
MTRETKIGLLVGLAFIIVIGILLSDQLMRSTEPPAAPLASVADTVRRGTATPAPVNPPVTRVETPRDVTPENQVPMREEVVNRAPPVTFVEVRPGANTGNTGIVAVGPVVGGNEAVMRNLEAQAQSRNANNNPGPIARTNDTNTRPNPSDGRTIADVAAQHGETLLGPDGQPLRTANTLLGNSGTNAGNSTALPRPANPYKQVKAESGDSLSRLASRHMGANTKANRDAIIKANPSLAADPNKIIIGQTYNIPAPAAATPSPAVASNDRGNPSPAPTPTQTEYWYTVKQGDSLWKIAAEQCGDANAVAAIKELNRETLKGGDTVQLNMKLRLPAKPLASAR